MSYAVRNACTTCRQYEAQEGANQCYSCIQAAQAAIRAIPHPASSSRGFSGYATSFSNAAQQTASSLARHILPSTSPAISWKLQSSFTNVSRDQAEKLLDTTTNCLFRSAGEYKDCPVILDPSLEEACYRTHVFVLSYRHKDLCYHVPVVLGLTKHSETHRLFIAQHEESAPPYSQGVLKILPDLPEVQVQGHKYMDILHNLTLSAESAGKTLCEGVPQQIIQVLKLAFKNQLYSAAPASRAVPVNYETLAIADLKELSPLQWHQTGPEHPPVLRSFTLQTAESYLEKTPPFQLLLWQDEDRLGQMGATSLFLSYKIKEKHYTHIPLTLIPQSATQSLLFFGRKEADSFVFPRNTLNSVIPPFVIPANVDLSDVGRIAAPYLEKGLLTLTGMGFASVYRFQWLGGSVQFRRDLGPEEEAAQQQAQAILSPSLPRTFLFYHIKEVESKNLIRDISLPLNFGLSYKDTRGKIEHKFVVLDRYKSKLILADKNGRTTSPWVELDFPPSEKQARPDFKDALSSAIYLIDSRLMHQMAEKITKAEVNDPYSFKSENRLPVAASKPPSQDYFGPSQTRTYKVNETELNDAPLAPSSKGLVPRNLRWEREAFLNHFAETLSAYLREQASCLLGGPRDYKNYDILIPEEQRTLVDKHVVFNFYYRKEQELYAVPLILGFSSKKEARLFLAQYIPASNEHPRGALKILPQIPSIESRVQAPAGEIKGNATVDALGNSLIKTETRRLLYLLKVGIENHLAEEVYRYRDSTKETGEGFTWASRICLSFTKERAEDKLTQYPPHTVLFWTDEGAQGPLASHYVSYKRANQTRDFVHIGFRLDASTGSLVLVSVMANQQSKNVGNLSLPYTDTTATSDGQDLSTLEKLLFQLTKMKFKGSSVELPSEDLSQYEQGPFSLPDFPAPAVFTNNPTRREVNPVCGPYDMRATSVRPPVRPNEEPPAPYIQSSPIPGGPAPVSKATHHHKHEYGNYDFYRENFALSQNSEERQGAVDSFPASIVPPSSQNSSFQPYASSSDVPASGASLLGRDYDPSAFLPPNPRYHGASNIDEDLKVAPAYDPTSFLGSSQEPRYAGASSFGLSSHGPSLSSFSPSPQPQPAASSLSRFKLNMPVYKTDSGVWLNAGKVQGKKGEPIVTGQAMQDALAGKPPGTFIVATTSKTPSIRFRSNYFCVRVGFIDAKRRLRDFFLDFDSNRNEIHFYQFNEAKTELVRTKQEHTITGYRYNTGDAEREFFNHHFENIVNLFWNDN